MSDSDETHTGQSAVEEANSFALDLPSVQCALEYLQRDEIKKLQYHNESHTLDVLREAALFAVNDGLSERKLTLLMVAAAWHDVGFVEARDGHEMVSARIFEEEFKQHSFPEISSDDVPSFRR